MNSRYMWELTPMKWIVCCVAIVVFALDSGSAESKNWRLAFSDSGSQDWTKEWFLEGGKAKVENTEDGMMFSAGPVPMEQASHAVLWTKQSFAGDVRIEYDYTRLDAMTDATAVNILYIQATGLGTTESPKDILLSTKQRDVPWMKLYLLNMNALHISYSTTGPNRAPTSRRGVTRPRI